MTIIDRYIGSQENVFAENSDHNQVVWSSYQPSEENNM
jgi:hypothetical protein